MAKAQSLIRAEEKKAKVSVEQKVLAVEAITRQNSKEAEKSLLGLFPQAEQEAKTKVKAQGAETSILTVTLPNEVISDLRKVAEHLSHIHPDMDLAKVIETLVEEYLKKKSTQKTQGDTVRKTKGRAVPAATRRVVMERAKRRCEYRDPKTGRQCESTYQVEIDHRLPWSLGGTHDPSNLQCLCRAHNSLMAEKILGKAKANAWRTSDPPQPKYINRSPE